MVEVRERVELQSMKELCEFVKAEIDGDKYKECERRICRAMAEF